MIVCSCNVLSDRHVRAVLDTDLQKRPRTAGQLYKCMGCKPECGRCLATIQRIMVDHGAACSAGCAACPVAHVPEPANDGEALPLVAAE